MPLPLFTNAKRHRTAPAIIDPRGTHTYDQLLRASASTAAALLQEASDLNEARISFLVPPGFDYAATQWGIWRAGGIAVPLPVMHPPSELEHVLDDARVSAVVIHPDFEDRIRPLTEPRSLRLVTTEQALRSEHRALPELDSSRRAMILYTSGTTGKPRGVVLTHGNIQAQVETLVEAWEWTRHDHILSVLPLHHVHGIINVLTCALWVGAKCEILPRFDARLVWERLSRGDITLFMAVPTIYSMLITAWNDAATQQRKMAEGHMRLMVSGSAALPVSTSETWLANTGHTLLERYGMTEIGMALSNPLHGRRVPGHVGGPLPNVEVRLVDDAGHAIDQPDTPGEIQVRGPTVMREYWGLPEATKQAFCGDWFRTGDVAVVSAGGYRILGRKSVDIIKTGGYKISALEVEETLRCHPDIRECCVMGIPDPVRGESVATCVVLREGSTLTTDELRKWAKDRLAPYKIPTRLRVLDQLSRNSMGKVQKSKMKGFFEA